VTAAAKPPRLSRAESKQNTRRLLMAAADRVFMQRGYQRATLESIAAEAGFTKGAVYFHFGSKEDLFIELLVDGLERNIGQFDQLIASAESEPDKLNESLGQWIDRIGTRNNLPLLALEMELESRCNENLFAQFDEATLSHQKSLGRLIARYFAVKGRTSPVPCEELVASIFSLAKGIALARQTKPSAERTSTKLIKLLLGVPAEAGLKDEAGGDGGIRTLGTSKPRTAV
jgi:AcrR family transcriptional regulator